MATIGNPSLPKLLNDMNAAQSGGAWMLCLFQNNVVPSGSMTPGTFTEANYSGYARYQMAFAAATGTTGTASAVDPGHQFAYSGAGASNTIYGWYLLDTVGNVVIAADVLPTPKTMAAVGDTLTVTLTDILT